MNDESARADAPSQPPAYELAGARAEPDLVWDPGPPLEMARPARAADGGIAAAAAVAIVATAWAVLQLSALGRTPFHTHGEPREAVVIQDLVQHGRWILPRRNAVSLPRKPPLYYWLGGIAAHLRGRVDELSARLPSAVLSGIAALLLTVVVARAGTPRAGAAAGLVLLTSLEWARAATAARVDMTLAFGLLLVFAALLRLRQGGAWGWIGLLYVGATWATLAKGIPGLAIPALQIAFLCAVDRSTAFLRTIRPLRGLAVVLVIVGAWYAAAAAQGGRAFIDIAVRENLMRIASADASLLGHRHGAAYLVGALLLGLLPWTALLPSVARALWRDRTAADQRDPRLFAVVWIVAVLLPHALASSKRGVYLLPLYPAVALLIGWWADRAMAGALSGARLRAVSAWLLWSGALLLSVLALSVLAQLAGLPLLDPVRAFARGRGAAHIDAIITAAAGARGCQLSAALGAAAALAVVGALGARARRATGWLIGVFGCTAALILAVRLVILPAIATADTRRSFAEALRAAVRDPAVVHTAPQVDYGLLFYWGGEMPTYDPTSAGEGPAYLVMPESAWQRAQPPLSERFARIPSLRVPRTHDGAHPVALERRLAPNAN
ncbi:MAG: ArnT family glycosyltransferase [Candidatus Binatia bacterium]